MSKLPKHPAHLAPLERFQGTAPDGTIFEFWGKEREDGFITIFEDFPLDFLHEGDVLKFGKRKYYEIKE